MPSTIERQISAIERRHAANNIDCAPDQDMRALRLYRTSMEPSVKIGIAHDMHAEDISKVICDAIRMVNAQDYPAAEIERLIGNFTTPRVLAFLKQRRTIVALSNSEVVGTGSLQGCELKSLFVSPKMHRKGIGSLLVKELERVAVERGLKKLTVSSSLSAVGFYEALGYVEQSRAFFGAEETVAMTKPMVPA